ncbi:hypothetical protein BDV19DRAFT_386154 [Aspergillus venezuelensis]
MIPSNLFIPLVSSLSLFLLPGLSLSLPTIYILHGSNSHPNPSALDEANQPGCLPVCFASEPGCPVNWVTAGTAAQGNKYNMIIPVLVLALAPSRIPPTGNNSITSNP